MAKLFTTQDGVDIHEGDTYYLVQKIGSESWQALRITANPDLPSYLYENQITFSTSELALSYIENQKNNENKPIG